MVQIDAGVISNISLGGDYSILKLTAPEAASEARPGQFLQLRIPGLEYSALRRPFSFCAIDGGVVSLLYKKVGRGTEMMRKITAGDTVNIIGPLGNGFPFCAPDAIPLLVGGGFGVAPLLFFAEVSPVRGIIFIGGHSACDILLRDEFEKLGWDVRVCTEDGSCGTKGLVTVEVDSWVKANSGRKAEFFACGPEPMLRALDARAVSCGAKAWLSLDRRMACGVGACLGCVQKVYETLPNGNRVIKQKRVCVDGPVFAAGELVWEDV